MSAHTPGPWKRGHMMDAERAWVGPEYDVPPVAHIDRNERDEWEANARLIAAAPELLEAACHFIRWADEPAESALGMVREQEWLAKARAAIARATGAT